MQNALDASPPGDPVVVSTRRLGRQFIIDVVDRGAGMDEAFIRDELFLPFRSTKSGGYGIGAFQTRELIRMAGGDLEVISRAGSGHDDAHRLAARPTTASRRLPPLRHETPCRRPPNRC